LKDNKTIAKLSLLVKRLKRFLAIPYFLAYILFKSRVLGTSSLEDILPLTSKLFNPK